MTAHSSPWTLHERHAWALLQAARSLADEFGRATAPRPPEASITYDPGTDGVDVQASHIARADLHYHEARWQPGAELPEPVHEMLALYLPVLGTHDNPDIVIGHLGQSLDSAIATASGDAVYVTGEENRKHLHRLRSLCQAVLVGASTAGLDDPQLTTRAVTGENPVRVIIDPDARLSASLSMLGDGEAPVWLLHDDAVDIASLPAPAGTRRLSIPRRDGMLQPADILKALRAAGIRRLFVEGGGVTVSRFYTAGCLDRLQIAVAPLLVGTGTPALQLPAADRMRDAHRPAHTLYRMGDDILWDFDLHRDEHDSADTDETADVSQRIAQGPSLQKIR